MPFTGTVKYININWQILFFLIFTSIFYISFKFIDNKSVNGSNS